MVLKRNAEQQQKTQHIIPLEILRPQDALHYGAHTQQADREHNSWLYVTQEEISRIPVGVLRRAMSSVHSRLAECEHRNGGHLEDVTFRVE